MNIQLHDIKDIVNKSKQVGGGWVTTPRWK